MKNCKTPEYPDIIALIPEGLPQLIDFEVAANAFDRSTYAYHEEPLNNPVDEPQARLHVLEANEDQELISVVSGQMLDPTYTLRPSKDLAPWMGKWLPIPFLREEHTLQEGGEPAYEKGPTNWARARIVPSPEDPENRLHITLAFDMRTEPAPQDSSVTYALTEADIRNNNVFSLASSIRSNAWFIEQKWPDCWIKQIWDQYWLKQRRNPWVEFNITYLASYQMLLAVIEKAIGARKVKIANPTSLSPVDVDLVLDIGNSRTSALLIETRVQRATNPNDSYVLQLRDVENPETLYQKPFVTRVEFAESNFGLENWSRRSGRRTPAFVTGSIVRTGPEACRLSSLSLCNEGVTGMSSPKRYLWDERPWEATWRFNSKEGEAEKLVTSLPFELNELGIPPCCQNEPRFRSSRVCRAQERDNLLAMPAMESKFCRSSLMMFMLMEIIQQALSMVNSPALRYSRELPEVARHLRKVVLTVPAGMPIAEQRIYRRWADFAVRTLWEALGWEKYYVDLKSRKVEPNYQNRPQIFCDWDEATCTQLVYLYNELVSNFQGDSQLFYQLRGRATTQYGKPGIRIASIDIGGGTSDLSITTFVLENDEHSTTRISPKQELRDGFNLAGDDVVKAIIRDIVLPAISNELETRFHCFDANKIVADAFGKNSIGSTHKEQNRRAQFINQVALPATYALLSLYEQYGTDQKDGELSFRIRDIFQSKADSQQRPDFPFALFDPPIESSVNYLKDFLAARGTPDFDIMDFNLSVPVSALDEKIEEIMRGILDNMAEVIQLSNCDVLLLTGRPSSWRAIRRHIFSLMPVAPDRIIPMKGYKVGSWYPFSDASNSIQDPKTTVVVGAILCSLAQSSLENLAFDGIAMRLKSTASFVGELDKNGVLQNEKIWFEIDVDDPNEQEVELKNGPVQFSSPIVIGFRQLNVARWTATRAYRLEFANQQRQNEAQGKMPYSVNMQMCVSEAVTEDNQTAGKDLGREEGEIQILEITDNQGNSVPVKSLQILLRTLRREEDEGCWIDTGIVCGKG